MWITEECYISSEDLKVLPLGLASSVLALLQALSVYLNVCCCSLESHLVLICYWYHIFHHTANPRLIPALLNNQFISSQWVLPY